MEDLSPRIKEKNQTDYIDCFKKAYYKFIIRAECIEGSWSD